MSIGIAQGIDSAGIIRFSTPGEFASYLEGKVVIFDKVIDLGATSVGFVRVDGHKFMVVSQVADAVLLISTQDW